MCRVIHRANCQVIDVPRGEEVGSRCWHPDDRVGIVLWKQLEQQLAKNNPIEGTRRLAAARISALFIHGSIHKVVPLKENSTEFLRRYEEAGVGDLAQVIAIEGQGHNFGPGFFHSQEPVDFTIRQARMGAARSGPMSSTDLHLCNVTSTLGVI